MIQVVEVDNGNLTDDIRGAFQVAAAIRFEGKAPIVTENSYRIARGVAFSEPYTDPSVCISESIYRGGVVVCPHGHHVNGRQAYYVAYLGN